MSSQTNYEKKEFFEANSKRFVYLKRLKGGCFSCGTHGNRYLQFHHRKPEEKLFAISWGVRRSSITKEMFDAELEKCDVLCIVCHKRVHASDRTLKGKPSSGKDRLKKLSRIANWCNAREKCEVK